MSDQYTTPTCPECGQPYPEGSILCPSCRARVAKPFMQAPPRWFVALLLVVIAGLAVYAVILALQVFVFHKF
ncbi:MAG: hypothetical protein ACYDCO_25700 [Armatimonadota bacterium]